MTSWTDLRTDPVLDTCARSGNEPSLDSILELYPRPAGEAAFDAAEIARAIERLGTAPAVNTGHPFLDLSVKTGLACVDATFRGDHPKYGVKGYAEDRHDAFPPTITAAVDALSAWGLHTRAAQLFRYWLMTFVNEDGTIRYYGPALSEYGQLLHTAALLHERAGPAGWWDEGGSALIRMATRLTELCLHREKKGELVPGVPEADISPGEPLHLYDATHSEDNRYFHNNAWIARGLMRWAELAEVVGARDMRVEAARTRDAAQKLEQRTLAAIRHAWPGDPGDWWLPPQVEPCPRPASLTDGAIASYTNYRYWPELLSSGVLPDDLANRVVDSRLSGGGQFCGMSRFMGHLDDWPLADYLYGLWQLRRKREFLVSLYGHIAYHQATDHLTAYEQMTFPPGKEKAPYCLPCQLVAARAARLVVG